MPDGIFKVEGYPFEFDPEACRECPGYCCDGPSGHIWSEETEIQQIALHLDLNRIEFLRDYTFRKDSRHSLVEKPSQAGYACVFFDTEKKCCSIYDVRPKQCRTFPFWPELRNREYFLLKECPGVIRKS